MNKAISIVASVSCLVVSAADVPDLTESLEFLGTPTYFQWPGNDHTRQVLDLAPYRGKIYVTGGDWDPNMGPCPIYAVDPYSGAFTNEFIAGTEDIYEFKEFSDGRLYACAVDPHEAGPNCGTSFRRGYDGTWQAFNTSTSPIHSWDIAEWHGYTFICGYAISCSTNWCETPMVDVTPELNGGSTIGSFMSRRFNAFLPFDDDIFCIPNMTAWGDDIQYYNWEEWRWKEDQQRFVSSNAAWSMIAPGLTLADASLTFQSASGSRSMSLWHPTKFRERVLYVLATSYPFAPWAAYSAENVNHHVKATKIDLGGSDVKPFDIFVAGDAAYMVAAQAGSTATAVTNSVWRSTDGVSFSKLFSFVSTRAATSLCYLDGSFYLGMGSNKNSYDTGLGWPQLPKTPELSGNIYRVRLPQGDAPQVVAESELRYVPESESCDVTFRLSSAPATNMTLRVWTTNEKIGLSASSLTFTPSNWNVAQTVRASFPEDWVEEAVGGAVVCGTGGEDCISGFVQLDMLDDEGDLTTPVSGVVDSTSSYWDANLQAAHAFDDDHVYGSGRWLARRKDSMFVVYKFNEATKVNVLRVWNASDTYGGYDSAGRSPKAWTFQGSNDGKNWTVLDTVTDQTGWSSTGEMREYAFSNGTAYQYYKYDCTALNDEVSTNNGEANVLQLWELEFLYRREYDPTPIEVLNPDGTADFYVSTVGSDSNTGLEGEPFATIGAAVDAANAAVAGGATGVTIHVAAGTYVGSGYTLDGAVTVVGEGAKQTVVDGNGGYRVFSLMSSDAALKNLAVSNAVFTAAEDSGAGVYMEAGLVEGCAIVSCGDFSHSKTRGGGVYASGGRISRTVFTGNKVLMRWSNDVGYGSALYLSDGAICENSLFTGNAAVPCPDFDVDRRRGGVVHMTGDGSALVNCTVVRNNLDDPAGFGNIADKFSGIVSLVKAKVVNCVAYGNIPSASYATANWDVYAGGDEWRNNWQNYVFNSAWGTGHQRDGNPDSPVLVDKTSFVDYDNGDFRPSAVGFLFDSGSDEEYDATAVSSSDLTGALRKQGASIDIGGYEASAASGLSVAADVDSYGLVVGAAATFSAAAAGGSGSYVYRWDFGDGSPVELTTSASVQHAFAAAGRFHVTLCASDDGGSSWCAPAGLQHAVAVAPPDIYVDAANANPAFPYDTPAKAAATFADAYGCLTNTVPETLNMAVVGGVTIHVAQGTYVGTGYVLAGAVTVKGAGLGKTVMDGNGGYRVFSLMSSDAALKNLAVSNAVFTAAEDSGAGVYMEAGLVEGCAIVSCGDFSHSKTRGGGIYACGGRISRTVFAGNKVHMRWSNNVGYGSALYLSNGAVCENSLFTGNAAASCFDWDVSHRRGGVVHLTDSGTALVNSMVVENTLSDLSGNNNNNYAGIVQKNSAMVVNCVAYRNRPDADFVESYGDVYAGGDANRNNWQNYFVNSAWDTWIAKAVAEAMVTTPSPIVVDASVFRNYARGLYTPTTGGVLVDAGTSWEDYLGYGAKSAVDLDGKPRKKGARLDIGCYESTGLYLYISIR